MSRLEKLKETQSLAEFAQLVGFTPSGLAYVLYKLDTSKKYRVFHIPKRSGGTREIKAPIDQLALLQRRVA